MLALSVLALVAALPQQTFRLGDIDLSAVSQGWGVAHKDVSVDGHPLTIGGTQYAHGVGTHAVSQLTLSLDGKAIQFDAWVGLDDEALQEGSVDFHVVCDGKEKWSSGVMRKGEPAKHVTVDLRGVKTLYLKVGDGGDDINYDHADWADAVVKYDGKPPKPQQTVKEKPYILTPKAPHTPRINGPVVLGARPGREFVWRIPATGDRPMAFSAEILPSTLKLDPVTGVVSGTTPNAGTYTIRFGAKNRLGEDHRDIRLTVGDRIALTPPMGWNSWNCFATAVDDAKVRLAADAFVKAGLVDHGWQYVNIDDCWSVIPHSNDPVLGGPTRNEDGTIRTNKKFPDMKSLTTYIHSMGLRAGIYSSPGPTTCGGYTSTYGHELQDAQQWANWGFDYIKYDWCSYSEILKPEGLDNLQKPYKDMQAALAQVNRDIVYSLCQYGMGDVWKWGESVNGNCWRTTGDIGDSWSSMSSIGFSQDGHEKYAGPGHWNDPDMLVVGWVGWGPQLHPTRLTPSEQYTHITLWSLLSAPLLIGCDLTKLDDFTLNLLTNDEVLAVDQDPLGQPAHRVSAKEGIEVWARPLADGTKAVGLFNRNDEATTVVFRPSEVGLPGSHLIRDLWRQKGLGSFSEVMFTIRAHGCELLKVK